MKGQSTLFYGVCLELIVNIQVGRGKLFSGIVNIFETSVGDRTNIRSGRIVGVASDYRPKCMRVFALLFEATTALVCAIGIIALARVTIEVNATLLDFSHELIWNKEVFRKNLNC